jgi:hypothetical protein
MTIVWLLLIALFFPDAQQSGSDLEELAKVRERANLEYERHRQAAIHMNEIAGRINSEPDALALVDAVADVFAEYLSPEWSTSSIRERVANAEYNAVADPLRLISEQRIADVWNKYVREIGASDDAIITAAEIHSMRDAAYATSQLLWRRGTNQSIWTMPNIYAVGSDGKVADGCRVVEALRVLYELDHLFDNLRSARARLRNGILLSDAIKKLQDNPNPSQKTTSRLVARPDTNSIRAAENKYRQAHGVAHINELLAGLFDELLPGSH